MNREQIAARIRLESCTQRYLSVVDSLKIADWHISEIAAAEKRGEIRGRREVAMDEVIWFAKVMEDKLKKNDHKTHWKYAKIGYLSKRLHQEAKELSRALQNNDETEQRHLEIIQECADVANFAMMIANNVAVMPVISTNSDHIADAGEMIGGN